MRFIESICFKDNRYYNLEFHNARWGQTHQKFFNVTPPSIVSVLPELRGNGTSKVRVVYGNQFCEVHHSPYFKKEINSLQIVLSKPFDYSYKFQDRSVLEHLIVNNVADDIIISIDGMITDSSYSNLAFWNGTNWLTPEKPLLHGVRRAQLLEEGRIIPAAIATTDLLSFQKVSLFNAMLDLGEVTLPTSSILFSSLENLD